MAFQTAVVAGRSASFGAIRSLMTDCNKYETYAQERGGNEKGVGRTIVCGACIAVGERERDGKKKPHILERIATVHNPSVCVCGYNVWMGVAAPPHTTRN